MILAFCIRGSEAPLELEERFGRSWGFAIVAATRSSGGDILRTLENSGRDSASAAGTGAIQILVNEGVEGIVAPHLGPKAEEARSKLGLKLWSQGNNKTLNSALEAWSDGVLEELTGTQMPRGLYRA